MRFRDHNDHFQARGIRCSFSPSGATLPPPKAHSRDRLETSGKSLAFLSLLRFQQRVRVFRIECGNDLLRSGLTRIVTHLEAVIFGVDLGVPDAFNLQHTLSNEAENLTAICADCLFLLKTQEYVGTVLFCRRGFRLAERGCRREYHSGKRDQNCMLSRIHLLSPFFFFILRSSSPQADLRITSVTSRLTGRRFGEFSPREPHPKSPGRCMPFDLPAPGAALTIS